MTEHVRSTRPHASHAVVPLPRAAGRRRRRGPTPALLVGDVPDVADLAARAAARPDPRFRPVGCCIPGSPPPGAYLHELPVVGDWHHVADALVRSGAVAIVLADGRSTGDDVIARVSAEAAGVGARVMRAEQVTEPRRTCRELTERALAVVLLALLMPVLVATALLVRAAGPGPLLTRETRVGRDGMLFPLLRFRAPDGGLLHRWALDELPQLLNVARGELALVGPRPRRPSEAALAPSQPPGLLGARRGEPVPRPSAR